MIRVNYDGSFINKKGPLAELMRIVLEIFSVLLAVVFIASAFIYGYNTYSFRNYEVDIVVSEDKECRVHERFEVVGELQERMGRDMQYCHFVQKPDGTYERYHLRIEQVDGMRAVANGYAGIFKNLVEIPIRTRQEMKTGINQCELSYTMFPTSDFEAEDNQLFYSIIGHKNRTNIYGVTFSVELPYAISEEQIQVCVVDNHGKMQPVPINLKVEGNCIGGTYDKMLPYGNGLALLVDLEDGYFQKPFNWKPYILFLIIGMVLAGSYYVWWHYGKGKYAVIDTVEFDAPNGLNSLELGYFHDGHVSGESIMAMFFTMAGKGYIQIEKYKKDWEVKNRYIFVKIRDYDGDNPLEKSFMEMMFEESNVLSSDDLVFFNHYFMSRLGSFEGAAREYLNRKYPLYVYNTQKKTVWIIIAMILAYVITFILAAEPYMPDLWIRILWHFMYAAMIPGLYWCCRQLASRWKRMKIFLLEFSLCAIAFLIVTWIPSLSFEPIYLGIYSVGLCTIFACIWFWNHFDMRTQRYAELKGKIMGYKKFLQHVENNRINILFEENKLLYYEVVANAYVLKVNWKWASELEDVLIPSDEY